MSGAYQAKVAPREQCLQLRGLQHRVLQWGPVEAPPVFLLHGFQDCADTFQFFVDLMPGEWHFIAPDLRGFGGTQWTNEPYWFPDYLADFEALLDHFSLTEGVRVIGHSMGGNIAMLYAGIRPQRIAAVVSLEGFGLRRSSSERSPARYAEWLNQLRHPPAHSTYASVEDLAQKLLRRNPRLGVARARFVADAWLRPGETRYDLRFDPWHRLVNPIPYRREEAEACWRSISAPVLSVLGSESEQRKWLDADGDTQRFHQALARVTVVDLEGVGHMLHHEAPERVAEVVSRWFVKEGVTP